MLAGVIRESNVIYFQGAVFDFFQEILQGPYC
jgi:hypothetical protein